MTKFDLISVGDNATDAFIKLSEAELNCDINRPECKICMRFAAKIPYESVTEVPAGGNSSNVVLGGAKLGLKTAYLSNIGDDANGQKTLAKLTETGVDTTWVKQNAGVPTNYNYVLWYADDRTILVKHENYSNDWPEDLSTPTWLYLSSVSDHDFSLHEKIAAWLVAHPEVKLAFSPGTWQLKKGKEKLKDIYARTEIFFGNKQEAEKVVNLPGYEAKELAIEIKKIGPKIVVITDGTEGAYCLDQEDKWWKMPALTTKAFERTGAGDGFASAFLSAIFYEQPVETALAWGAVNASSVVAQVGPHAGQLTRDQIEAKIKSDNLIAKQI
ncbi:MAG: carbohydrate kinase family protein [Candidatus Paceibacterota bacterium]